MNLKVFGGEIETKSDGLFSYITDSGRSSLRLILQGVGITKKYLLPVFLCKVIIDIFKELKINYSFYDLKGDLSIDAKSIQRNNFDVLYVIDYFGNKDEKIKTVVARKHIVIEDCVFLPLIEKPDHLNNWVGFNSFRKISALADGSIIKSTIRLDEGLIMEQTSEFSYWKYKAKDMKYNYLNGNLYSEDEYITIFQKAENMIDKQNGIHTISKRSLFKLFDFYLNMEKEFQIRRANYKILDEHFQHHSIKNNTAYPSFYVLCLENRDDLRNYLFQYSIFLPVHWPSAGEILHNSQYAKLISIPVDSRYTEDNMLRVSGLINKFLKM